MIKRKGEGSMILGLILYSAVICAFAAMLRFMQPSPSSRLVRCIRYQVECIFDLFGKWVPYLIAVVPVLIILALSSQSNQFILSLEILYLFSLLLLVLFHRIKQSQIPAA